MSTPRWIVAFGLSLLVAPLARAAPSQSHEAEQAVKQAFDAASRWNQRRIHKADGNGRPLRLHPKLPLSWRKSFLVKSWNKRDSLLNSFVRYVGGKTPSYDYVGHIPDPD